MRVQQIEEGGASYFSSQPDIVIQAMHEPIVQLCEELAMHSTFSQRQDDQCRSTYTGSYVLSLEKLSTTTLDHAETYLLDI